MMWLEEPFDTVDHLTIYFFNPYINIKYHMDNMTIRRMLSSNIYVYRDGLCIFYRCLCEVYFRFIPNKLCTLIVVLILPFYLPILLPTLLLQLPPFLFSHQTIIPHLYLVTVWPWNLMNLNIHTWSTLLPILYHFFFLRQYLILFLFKLGIATLLQSRAHFHLFSFFLFLLFIWTSVGWLLVLFSN